MKKILLLFTVVSGFWSCSNEFNSAENEKKSNENVGMKLSLEDLNVGQMHNDILDIYYATNDYNSDDITVMEGAVDQYFENNFPETVSFSTIKDLNPNLYRYSVRLNNAQGNVAEIKNLFRDIHQDGLSSTMAYNYSLELVEIFEEYEGDIPNFKDKIVDYRAKVNNDSTLDTELKLNLNYAIDIAEYSHKYWYEIKEIELPQYGAKGWTQKVAIIAGGDTAGALTGIQTGLVGYASLVFPGWGGVVALAATAAIGSLNAARILR